jgi:hypothetical protein
VRFPWRAPPQPPPQAWHEVVLVAMQRSEVHQAEVEGAETSKEFKEPEDSNQNRPWP